ncbi:MAG: AI-2E family transporter [bacterium]|nr:AI-2E family transporter [bacterium]
MNKKENDTPTGNPLYGLPLNSKEIAKWIIGVVTACILIYLAIRHIDIVAVGITWIVNILSPILLGIILALVLNVPMQPIENHLRLKKEKARRPLAIILSLLLILGIFVGVAFLVIPEITNTVRLTAQIVMSGIDQAASLEQTLDFSSFPFGEYLEQIDIDWIQLKNNLEKWTLSQKDVLLKQAAGAVTSIAGAFINFFVGIVFSIYTLANKEKLKTQTLRFIHAWLPQQFGASLIHVVSICNQSFRNFIAGQATEAVILGTLCTIGMLILRLPYAPMIGALVGVTALIPVVGAFIGTIIGAFLILTVSPFKALVFVTFLMILQQFEGNVIYPKVVGSKINLPAMWVLAAVTIGGNLAGPFGMLLGVPAASAAYELLKEATIKRELKMDESQKNNGEKI